MSSPPPKTSFRALKAETYAQSYMMPREIGEDRRKSRIDALQQGLVAGLIEALPPGAMVLDVPCGNGRMTQLVTRADLKLAAMDYNLSMLQAMAQRGTGRMLQCRAQADVMRLPLPDKSVDLLIDMRLLHHVPDQETRVAMIREMMRVCRGRIVTSYWTTHCWRYLRKRLLGKRIRGVPISPGRFADACERAGLIVERQTPMRRFIEDEIVVIGRPR